jgi:hypothetical protein
MVYLQTTYELCFGKAYFEHFESCDFCRENTNIDVSVFMFDLRIDKYVIKNHIPLPRKPRGFSQVCQEYFTCMCFLGFIRYICYLDVN